MSEHIYIYILICICIDMVEIGIDVDMVVACIVHPGTYSVQNSRSMTVTVVTNLPGWCVLLGERRVFIAAKAIRPFCDSGLPKVDHQQNTGTQPPAVGLEMSWWQHAASKHATTELFGSYPRRAVRQARDQS